MVPEVEAGSLMKNPKSGLLHSELSELGLNPQMNTTFDWLEAERPRELQTQGGGPLKAFALRTPRQIHCLRIPIYLCDQYGNFG